MFFVREETLDGLKEALQQGRTVVWYQDQLVGRKAWLEALFVKCVQAGAPHLRSGNNAWVEIRNVCDADVHLEKTGGPGPARLTLPARTTALVKIGVGRAPGPIELHYTATNFLTAPETGLPVALKIPDR